MSRKSNEEQLAVVMVGNLMLVCLLAGLTSLTSGVFGSLGFSCFGGRNSDKNDAYESINNYLISRENDPNYTVNLKLIKDLAGKEDHSCPARMELVRELAKLDADRPCEAEGLSGLRNSVQVIRAGDNDAFRGAKGQRRLSKMIDEFAKVAWKCPDKFKELWRGNELGDFGDAVSRLHTIEEESVSAVNRYYNEHCVLSDLKTGKLPFYYGVRVKRFLDRVSGKAFIKMDESTGRRVKFNQSEALHFINESIIKPCEKFSKRPEVKSAVKPTADFMVARYLLGVMPMVPDSLEAPTTGLLICEWLMSLDHQRLAKLVSGSSRFN